MPDYVVEPPDLLLVEVLEALPGRPITGERLVRPDGTISLGFYGEVYVAGLTTQEVKEKIVLHLRQYLSDEVAGTGGDRRQGEQDQSDDESSVDPRDSDRVFVDVTAYNSKVYYIQGDVGQPGRLPITGNETVLDAHQLRRRPDPDRGAAEYSARPARPAGCLLRAGPAGQPRRDRQRRRPDDQLPDHARRPDHGLSRPDRPHHVFLDRLAAPFQHGPQLDVATGFTARTIKSINIPINGAAGAPPRLEAPRWRHCPREPNDRRLLIGLLTPTTARARPVPQDGRVLGTS